MTVNRSLLLLVIAIVCFAVGLLIALNVVHGSASSENDWLFGGLLAFAAAHIP